MDMARENLPSNDDEISVKTSHVKSYVNVTSSKQAPLTSSGDVILQMDSPHDDETTT